MFVLDFLGALFLIYNVFLTKASIDALRQCTPLFRDLARHNSIRRPHESASRLACLLEAFP